MFAFFFLDVTFCQQTWLQALVLGKSDEEENQNPDGQGESIIIVRAEKKTSSSTKSHIDQSIGECSGCVRPLRVSK